MTLTMEELGTIGTKKVSQELFREAVETIPSHIEYAGLEFTYAGIPRFGYEDDEKKYVSECVQQGVMPFSQLKLNYKSDFKCFILETSFNENFLGIDRNSTEEIKNASFNGMLKGGKIHSMETLVGDGHNLLKFEDFKEEFLKKFLEAGYHLSGGDFWLSSYHLTGYNQGNYRESGMLLEHRKGIELQLEKYPNADGKQRLVEWFTQLTEKHDAKVYATKLE